MLILCTQVWVSNETHWFTSISFHWTGIAQLVIQGNCQLGKEVHVWKNFSVFIEQLNTSDGPAQGERGEWTGYKQQALKSVSETQLSECSTFPHLSHRAGRTSGGKGVRLLLGKCRRIPKRRKEGKDSWACYAVMKELPMDWFKNMALPRETSFKA